MHVLRMPYACPTDSLRTCYELNAEKLHYTTATLRYNTLPFLTHTVDHQTYT